MAIQLDAKICPAETQYGTVGKIGLGAQELVLRATYLQEIGYDGRPVARVTEEVRDTYCVGCIFSACPQGQLHGPLFVRGVANGTYVRRIPLDEILSPQPWCGTVTSAVNYMNATARCLVGNT